MNLLSRTKRWNGNWVCRTCRNLSTSAAAKQVPERKAWQKLPTTPARTRFAPSPTGNLHLGSLRTALFNYLLARATRGQFILRVEDTDKKRIVAGAEKRLCEDLKWAGLQWDEGPDNGGPNGPYRQVYLGCRTGQYAADNKAQSERTYLYTDHAQKLLQSGHAYRCFCAPERLNELARQRNKLGLSSEYDRTCAGILKEESDERASKGEGHIIRLKAPTTPPDYFDIVYGAVGQSKSKKSPLNRGESTYDDSVLIKSDGLPTYHLANVVDDHHMRITHVIRASEWMTSTPKHLFMYKAFGWEPPHFAHVGLLQDIKRQKFSKRNADLDIRTFQNDGIFPEALVNYVALHGWSHNLGNDFLSLQDLVQNFDLKFTKGNTIVQPTKLMYLQKKYARKHVEEGGAVYESMVDRVYDIVEQRIGLKKKDIEFRNRIAAFMRLVPETFTTPENFYERHIALFKPVERLQYIPTKDNNGQELVWNVDLPSSINDVFTKSPSRDRTPWTAYETKELVNRAISSLSRLSALHTTMDKAGTLDKTEPLKAGTEKEHLYNAAVNHYLRWAIMGGKPGPAVADCMVLLGREETLKRMQDAARILGVPK